MGLSMKETVARLSPQEQADFLAGLDLETLQAIAREEWFWVQRPEQVPPEGNWSVHTYMAGRGAGKTRSGAEWLVQRTLDFPFDSSGFPTERLVMAYNLSDCRTTCIEGPSGILRVLQRRGFEEIGNAKIYLDPKNRFKYVKSPKPHIMLLETEAKIHFTGADPDAPRGFNLADVWCVAKGEPIATRRGLIPVELVTAGDQVWAQEGWCPVLAAARTKTATRVVRIETTAGSVRVTPEHLVWANGAWVQAGSLTQGDIMETCLYQMPLPQAMRQPSTTGMANAGTSTKKLDTTTAGMDPFCIAATGFQCMDQYPTDTSFTTSTEKDGTIAWKTWSFSPSPSTEVELSANVPTPIVLEPHSWPGPQVMVSEKCGNAGPTSLSSAISAVKPTTPTVCVPDGAPGNVATRPGSLPPEPSVLRVVEESELYDVYDLAIEGAREFHAGGGLLKIHNCDEIVKWVDARQVWREGIRPALRADLPGDKPRAFVTTTPKPIQLLHDWVNDPHGRVSIVRGSTFDNAANLSEDFLEEVKYMYEGTALGRQELYGELLDALEGALFGFSAINSARVDIGPDRVAHRALGVDPGLTGEEDGDEMGVVVACRDWRDHIYVVADETITAAGREAALHAWRVFDKYRCDTLVYESNLGKAWMHQVLTDAFRELQRAGVFPVEVTTPPLVAVHSNYGKKLRAEPIAMRYSQGRIHHIGKFDKLEAQMLTFDPLSTKHNSPDRLDALVHVCQHLIEGESRRTRIISPLNHQAPGLQVSKLGEPGNWW